MSAFRVGANVARFSPMTRLLRSHVTHSSARLAAVEAVPQRDFLQTILQRGHRFLKQFRQRLAQSHFNGNN